MISSLKHYCVYTVGELFSDFMDISEGQIAKAMKWREKEVKEELKKNKPAFSCWTMSRLPIVPGSPLYFPARI